jgi:hypothetical protein
VVKPVLQIIIGSTKDGPAPVALRTQGPYDTVTETLG